MTHGKILNLAADADAARDAAEALFATVAAELKAVLPASAEILHIGATAVPGCLTKGDLDITVRVTQSDFAAADALLAKRFGRNTGSVRTESFTAFEKPDCSPHLGVQLVAKGDELDVFHQFAEALRQDPDLVRRYNELKLRFDGQPMADYRAAKDAFVRRVLSQLGLPNR